VPSTASRLRKLSDPCLRLPEAKRETHGNYADFRVRGKVFAYFLDDHDRDGIVSVCCRSQLGENVDRAARDPERYYVPPPTSVRADGSVCDSTAGPWTGAKSRTSSRTATGSRRRRAS
jgi:hypothetical protein